MTYPDHHKQNKKYDSPNLVSAKIFDFKPHQKLEIEIAYLQKKVSQSGF